MCVSWVALGVESALCDLLVDIVVSFGQGYLYVKSRHRGSPCGIEHLSYCLLSLCKWQQFSDSRWLTIGSVSRSLVASIAVGLPVLVEMALSDATTSRYYLGGFSRLSHEIRCYVVVASVAGHACDPLLYQLLDDDRTLRQAGETRNAFWDDVEWIACISAHVWDRLAVIADVVPCLLRHYCLRSATIA